MEMIILSRFYAIESLSGSHQTESRKQRDRDDEPCEGSTSPSYRISKIRLLSFCLVFDDSARLFSDVIERRGGKLQRYADENFAKRTRISTICRQNHRISAISNSFHSLVSICFI